MPDVYCKWGTDYVQRQWQIIKADVAYTYVDSNDRGDVQEVDRMLKEKKPKMF